MAGFHLRNPETGKAVSFTVYESGESLTAVGEALGQRPEDGRVGIDPDEVDYTETSLNLGIGRRLAVTPVCAIVPDPKGRRG